MKACDVHWSAGETSIQNQIEHRLANNFQSAILLHESAHRTVHRVILDKGPDSSGPTNDGPVNNGPMSSVVIKIHHTATGRHPLRETWKRRLGISPARREWKALENLFDAGVPVPRPRAWGRLPNGDEIIVLDFIDGERVSAARTEVVNAMASSIAKLHGAGYRHGDLHLGNFLALDQEIILLDFQRARRQRSPYDRLFDLARLEFSLARAGWKPAARQALRDRLGVGRTFEPILRRFLRDHLRGRTRRFLRIGRNWRTTRIGQLRGLRDTSLDQEALVTLVDSCQHESPTRERRGGRVELIEGRFADSEDCERVVLVKRIAAGSLRRALTDRLRGTPAARAFHAGQTSALLSKRAARPLAFLEERRFGLPTKSLLVLEKVGDEDLDQVFPGSPKAEHRLACALGEWLADGHAWGLSHRDFKASNIRVTIRPDSIEFWMIDLEDLSGPSKPSDEGRLHALSQLNASLADGAFSTDARLAALKIYQARLPFSPKGRNAASEIARRSLARAHRWRGHDCPCRNR